MSQEQAKMQELVEQEGYEDEMEMLEARGLDSCVPVICMNKGCDYTADMEPDQDAGWCEMCDTNTVKSMLMIAGLI